MKIRYAEEADINLLTEHDKHISKEELGNSIRLRRIYIAEENGNFAGWLLDIARCLYTLRTGEIIAKTAAADWALENNLCPVPNALKIAVKVRKAPLLYEADKQMLDYAETLGESIQRFADVLEKELEERRIWQ